MILTVTMNVAIDKRYVIDEFKFGTVMRVKECNYTAGGKGLNVSKVASLLDEEVIATGIVGGYAGKYVINQLDNLNVKSDFTEVSGETRSCINFYDSSSKVQTEFLEPGVTVSNEDIKAFLDKYELLAQKADVISISGSVPKGFEKNFYCELIRIAKVNDKPVLVDTSGDLLKNAVKSNPTFVKPNTDEISQITDIDISDEKSIIKAALNLHQSGVENVVVSLGGDGAILVCDKGIFRGYAPKIEVVNTVGCGDSMVAAFAVGLSRKSEIEETFKLALAVGTANALCVETGHFRKEDLEVLLEKVEIKKIK